MQTNDKTYWFLFRDKDLFLRRTGNTYAIPYEVTSPVTLTTEPFLVSTLLPAPCAAAYVPNEAQTPPNYEFVGLRKCFELLPSAAYRSAGKCAELLYWDLHSRYCTDCGTPMQQATAISKRCPACGHEMWPMLATAIIVLVQRGDEVLLVQAKNFVSDFYGLVAGFVETGETLEECVHREVMEETQLSITNVRYFASQPWPYPCGLMVGFMADYESGDLCLQQTELNTGAWFSRTHLPKIPDKLSMARMLLDEWIEQGALE
ncbi:MAG: NAD(+) diphosphatase [Bacteroidaceae bacterium]